MGGCIYGYLATNTSNLCLISADFPGSAHSPSQLEAGGLCPQHKHGQCQAGLEHTFPQIWGGHGAGGAAAQSHFLILAYVLLVTFRSVLQLSSFLINRPDGSSLAYHPLLSCAVY